MNHERNIRQISIKGHSIKYLTSSQNDQGHQKQAKSEKLSQPQRA